MGHGETYEMDRLDHKTRGRSRLGYAGSSEQAIRVNRKASMDVGSTFGEGLELERRSAQESNRKSQQSTWELALRKTVQLHVERELAKGTEPYRPGLLRLPK